MIATGLVTLLPNNQEAPSGAFFCLVVFFLLQFPITVAIKCTVFFCISISMIYILFLIQLAGTSYSVTPVAPFDTMDDCFQARQQLIREIGHPIINYQAICVIQTTKSLKES